MHAQNFVPVVQDLGRYPVMATAQDPEQPSPYYSKKSNVSYIMSLKTRPDGNEAADIHVNIPADRFSRRSFRRFNLDRKSKDRIIKEEIEEIAEQVDTHLISRLSRNSTMSRDSKMSYDSRSLSASSSIASLHFHQASGLSLPTSRSSSIANLQLQQSSVLPLSVSRSSSTADLEPQRSSVLQGSRSRTQSKASNFHSPSSRIPSTKSTISSSSSFESAASFLTPETPSSPPSTEEKSIEELDLLKDLHVSAVNTIETNNTVHDKTLFNTNNEATNTKADITHINSTNPANPIINYPLPASNTLVAKENQNVSLSNNPSLKPLSNGLSNSPEQTSLPIGTALSSPTSLKASIPKNTASKSKIKWLKRTSSLSFNRNSIKSSPSTSPQISSPVISEPILEYSTSVFISANQLPRNVPAHKTQKNHSLTQSPLLKLVEKHEQQESSTSNTPDLSAKTPKIPETSPGFRFDMPQIPLSSPILLQTTPGHPNRRPNIFDTPKLSHITPDSIESSDITPKPLARQISYRKYDPLKEFHIAPETTSPTSIASGPENLPDTVSFAKKDFVSKTPAAPPISPTISSSISTSVSSPASIATAISSTSQNPSGSRIKDVETQRDVFREAFTALQERHKLEIAEYKEKIQKLERKIKNQHNASVRRFDGDSNSSSFERTTRNNILAFNCMIPVAPSTDLTAYN